MSIENWLSDEGRQAIERMGRPEWETFTTATRTLIGEVRGSTGPEWAIHDSMLLWNSGQIRITRHEALALLRDRAREWLAAADSGRSGYGDLAITLIGAEWLIGYEGEVAEEYLEISQDTDYDAALIAAVLAVGGE